LRGKNQGAIKVIKVIKMTIQKTRKNKQEDIIVGWNDPRLLSSKTLFAKTFHREIFEAWSVFVFNSSIANYLTSYYEDACHCNYTVFIFYEHEQNHNP
jgi:hypothetical protein